MSIINNVNYCSYFFSLICSPLTASMPDIGIQWVSNVIAAKKVKSGIAWFAHNHWFQCTRWNMSNTNVWLEYPLKCRSNKTANFVHNKHEFLHVFSGEKIFFFVWLESMDYFPRNLFLNRLNGTWWKSKHYCLLITVPLNDSFSSLPEYQKFCEK